MEGGWRGTALYESDCYVSDSSCRVFPFVPALLSLNVVHAVLCVRRLLLSGDVEENPGPGPGKEKQQEMQIATSDDGSIPSNIAKEILAAIHLQSQQQKEQNEAIHLQSQQQKEQNEAIHLQSQQQKELNEAILLQIQQQKEQNAAIREDLSAIKNDLSKVKQQCERINERCDSLEEKQGKLAAAVSELGTHVDDLSADNTRAREEAKNVAQTVQSLRQEMASIGEEMDRLEAFSRRDNLRMFGIPQASDTESYSQCARAVVTVLNSVEGGKTWTERDIVRAHRIGQARQGEPRPVIAKFQNWADKMTLLTDKAIRSKLERGGIRVANDLTRRQAIIVSQARRDGKSAFFVKGRLTVGPRRPDPRTYAEVTRSTSPTGRTTTTPASTVQKQTVAAISTGQQPAGRVGEASLPSNQATPTQAGNSPRQRHRNETPRQRFEGATSSPCSDSEGRDSQLRAPRDNQPVKNNNKQTGMGNFVRVTDRKQKTGSSRYLRSSSK